MGVPESRTKPFRHLTTRRKPTTLIIGFMCSQGTILVADTKITDSGGRDPIYDRPKILMPLPATPFVIGAAGYTDLFSEFNRKIPIALNTRLAEYRVRNIEAMMTTGLTRDQAIARVLAGLPTPQQQQQPQPNIDEAARAARPAADIELPYVYTAENFLDDCKTLTRQITEQADTPTPLPLEELIVLYRANEKRAYLHYISPQGSESTIDRYASIGSGSPYVEMFFAPHYRFDRPIGELVSLAVFVIAFVQRIAREPTVGFTLEHPPQVAGVLPNGQFGNWAFPNMSELLENTNRQLAEFETQIRSFTPTTIR
jgi:20S proteasome alpha/beta subunit